MCGNPSPHNPGLHNSLHNNRRERLSVGQHFPSTPPCPNAPHHNLLGYMGLQGGGVGYRWGHWDIGWRGGKYNFSPNYKESIINRTLSYKYTSLGLGGF